MINKILNSFSEFKSLKPWNVLHTTFEHTEQTFEIKLRRKMQKKSFFILKTRKIKLTNHKLLVVVFLIALHVLMFCFVKKLLQILKIFTI